MSAITTFLQSEQALKILGLPGLALLLAFVFYRTLVASRVVKPIGRNQSFIVLVLIIIYFSVVSVLLIWVYRPERAPVPATGIPAGKVEEPNQWSKVDTFFGRAELDTPLETFDATLGPATGDSAIDPERTSLRKRTYFTLRDGLLATVAHDGNSVQWIAAFDNAQKLKIPTLFLGHGNEDGSVRRFERLSDFDLEFLADGCDGKLEMPFAGRNGFYAVSPCYFGRPGSYNSYAFLFVAGGDQSPFTEHCSPMTLSEGDLTVQRVRQCRAGREKPFGFIVAGDEALLPIAIETFIETLDN